MEPPVFFIDHCLGTTVANALRAAGADVRVHAKFFSQDADDEVWIPDVAARGWVILTKDKNIRRRHGEREAALLANARIFTLSSGNLSGAVMAARFVQHLDAITQTSLALEPPFLIVVHAGELEVVYPLLDSAPSSDAGGAPEA